MPTILITSGPTREYLDPVRYLTNGSSGRMGVALADAVLRHGGMPLIVSGPTALAYPPQADVHWVETTEQMLEKCVQLFPICAGVIGAAAPCDFKPLLFSQNKITKSAGQNVTFQFFPTPDILAALGSIKRLDQWSVAFALETDEGKRRALGKMQQKNCDFIVLNNPDSIGRDEASFQIFDAVGNMRTAFHGSKHRLADELIGIVSARNVPH